MSPSRILASSAAPAAFARQRAPTAAIVAKRPAVAARAAALSTATTSPLPSSRPRLLSRRAVAAASSAASNDGVQGEMLDPSIFNKPVVRALSIAAGVAAAAAGTGAVASSSTLAAVHLTSWAVSLGTMIYVTFFAGIAMFKNMPRQAFGRIQSKLFPIYFSVVASCSVFALSSLYFGPGLLQKQAASLGTMLGATLVNLLFVEPAATRSMFERYELENASGARDEARIAELKKEFGKFHGISSLANLVALVAAVAHGAWLAQHLSLPMGGLAILAK